LKYVLFVKKIVFHDTVHLS